METDKFIDKIKINKFAGLVGLVEGYELYRFIDGTKDVDEAVVKGLLGSTASLVSILYSKIQNNKYDRL